MGSQFPRLFRIVIVKNLFISSILRFIYPFSRNFNFYCNLFDSKMEELEILISSLACLHLTPLVLDEKAWFLSSSGLFTVKSFFLVLSDSSPTFLANFV